MKLLEYECKFDEHRNERGELVYKHDGKIITFLDGTRCAECDRKAFILFQKMIADYNRKKQINIIIDIRNWSDTCSQPKQELLQILKIVGFWDKNH
jgi:hypothetical protein